MFGRWVSNGYLVTLCAASCALAVGASLVSVSVVRLGNVSPGFDANDLYAVELTLPGWKYKDAAQRRLAVTAVADRIEQLASVQGVAIASQAPPAAGMFIGDIAVGDQAVATPILPVAFIGAAYFRTIGQRVLVGREFDAADLANPMVAIISESFARRFAQRPEDLLGTRLQTGKDVREIVGVAADVRSPGVADQLNGLQAYWPLARLQPSTTLLVRSRGLRTSDARAAAAAIDPDLVIETSGVSEMLREARSEVWFLTALFAVLATVAILLAALGIFGVVSAFVARQRTAIAVRLAIGATPSIVRRWLAWRVLSRCAVGVAIGVLASYPFARLFAGQLFEVRANDATTRIIGALVVLAAALPAVAIPAMRAGRISPNQLMRQQ